MSDAIRTPVKLWDADTWDASFTYVITVGSQSCIAIATHVRTEKYHSGAKKINYSI